MKKLAHPFGRLEFGRKNVSIVFFKVARRGVRVSEQLVAALLKSVFQVTDCQVAIAAREKRI